MSISVRRTVSGLTCFLTWAAASTAQKCVQSSEIDLHEGEVVEVVETAASDDADQYCAQMIAMNMPEN